MTRDELHKLADLAGWTPTQREMASKAEWARLERFAALVAAAEREQCAKACDESVIGFGTETQWAQGYVQGIKDVADGIRARGTP